jgi:hypothetical protein
MNLKKIAVYFGMGLFLICFVACSPDRNSPVKQPKVVEQPKVETKVEEKKVVVLVSFLNETGEEINIDDLIDVFKKEAPNSDKIIFIHEGSQSGRNIDIMVQMHAYLIDYPANCIRIDTVMTDIETGEVNNRINIVQKMK